MVVETLDSATNQINHDPVDKHSKTRLLYPLYRHYPVDSVIHPSNNGLWSKLENFISLTIDSEHTVASINFALLTWINKPHCHNILLEDT